MAGAIEVTSQENTKKTANLSRELAKASAKDQETSLVIESTLANSKTDKLDLNYGDLYKSLSITSQKIIDKLNELLKADLPDGIQSLKPQDVTPEATADRIVTGTTAFFDIYAKQNPNLTGEELLNKFLDTIKSGIQSGYDDAVHILKGLGAFDIEGVQEGVEKTRSLIDEKLKAYETAKRKELGLSVNEPEPRSVETQSTEAARAAVFTQAGGSFLEVSA